MSLKVEVPRGCAQARLPFCLSRKACGAATIPSSSTARHHRSLRFSNDRAPRLPVQCVTSSSSAPNSGVGKIAPFKLERWFAKYEFSAPYLLCCSDCEALTLKDVLSMADDECKEIWDSLALGYTESGGLPLLVQEVCQLYDTVDQSEALILAPEEGVYLSMLSLLQPEDHVVVTGPGYQSLHEVARSIGCHVDMWLPRPTDKGLHFDVNDLESLLQDNTKLVVVNFPHNPTGALPSHVEWERIVGLVQRQGAYMFSDEMYRGLEGGGVETRLKSAVDMYEKAVVLGGMSKVYSLPGLRIGWLASRAPEVLDRCRELKDYTTICSSAPSEVLALIGLRNRQTLQDNNMDIINSNLTLLDRFFDKHPEDFKWHRPAAGSIAFPELLTGQTADAFCETLVEDSGILLLPSSTYEYAPSDGRQHFRLGFGRRNMPEVLERLDDYLSTR